MTHDRHNRTGRIRPPGRKPRCAVALAACLALVVNLLVPLIGGILTPASAEGIWVQICTTDGIEYRRIDFDGDTGGETEPARNHFGDCQVCAHCSFSSCKNIVARTAADWAGQDFAGGLVSWAGNPAICSPAAARGILKRAPPVA